MATNNSKKTRVNKVDDLQKVVDGFTKHEPTAPSVVFAGVTLKPSDVIARYEARIAQAKSVDAAAANWHSMVQTDKNAAAAFQPLYSTVKQVLLGAYSTQLDVLADFGLTPRKKPVVSPAVRTAAAIKAKATRAARGTKGAQQKAAITTQVTVAPAAATAVKVDGAGANPVVVTGASAAPLVAPAVAPVASATGASTAVTPAPSAGPVAAAALATAGASAAGNSGSASAGAPGVTPGTAVHSVP